MHYAGQYRNRGLALDLVVFSYRYCNVKNESHIFGPIRSSCKELNFAEGLSFLICKEKKKMKNQIFFFKCKNYDYVRIEGHQLK